MITYKVIITGDEDVCMIIYTERGLFTRVIKRGRDWVDEDGKALSELQQLRIETAMRSFEMDGGWKTLQKEDKYEWLGE